MTETPDQQISEFLDDELSRDECEFLVRRLSRDPRARRQALRYATIGAAMRGELLGPDPDVLRRRIGAALEGVHLPDRPEAPPLVQRGHHRFTRPALGAAIAASVAIAALVLVSSVGNLGERDDELVAESNPSAVPSEPAVGSEFLPSYVVPGSATTSPATITLTDYVVRHSQFTQPIRTPSIRSSVAGEQHYWRIVPASEAVE